MNTDSKVFGVSIRAWIAVALVSTVCFIYIIDAFATVWMNLHGSSLELKISEPLYSLAILAVSYYLGKDNKPTIADSGNTTTITKP